MKKYTKIFVTLFAFLALGFTNVNAKTVEKFANSTYIIGDYEFTPYSALTTDRIMLAAKSIKGDKLTDMIIYYKRSDNKWINAIIREELELNEEEIVIANIIDDFFEGDDLKKSLCELQAKYKDLTNYTVSSRNNMITALELPGNTSLEIKNKIDAIQNASKQLVIVAKWNVTETIGFAPHKKFTQKMEMMVGETKIDLSINNVEKITMAFNNQEAVELNANTDTVLWFDIERTSGDYTYYVETKDGQKYEAVLNWINNEKAIDFKLTYPDPIYNEQRKTYYIGYKALDGENQLPLAKPNLKYAASKVKTGNWVLREITEDTDFNLWFNIDNETDSYEYIFIDSENQVYKGVINWINRTHVVEGELRDLKAEISFINLTVYTEVSKERLATSLELPENNYAEIIVKIEAIKDARNKLTLNAVWNVTDIIGFAPHKKFTQKMEMMVGETKIDLSINNVEKITMAFNNQEAVELNANTDTVLWFDIERTSGDYTYYVETKDGQKYEAVLNWINNEKAIDFELTYPDPIYNEQRETYYIGYKALDGENQLPLAKPNLKYAASKVKNGDWVLREITEDTDFNLWFNVDAEAGSYEYIFVDSENQVYKGVINFSNTYYEEEFEKLTNLKNEYLDLFIYTSESREDLEVALKLPETKYSEVVAKIKAIKDARNKLTLNAVWNVTDIIGFAPHKKFTQKMEMMVGETKIDLSINNVEKITMAFNNQEAVELNANTDTVLWFDIERTSGDYTYYVETVDGNKYEAILNWEKEVTEITFEELNNGEIACNEERKACYVGYKITDDNPILNTEGIKYAASKIEDGSWELREVTDTGSNLWINVDNESGTYTYLFIDNNNKLYIGNINWVNKTNINKADLETLISSINKNEYTELSLSDFNEALKLPETTYLEIQTKIDQINQAIEGLVKLTDILNSLNENLTGNGLDLVSNNEKTELFNTLELNLETLNIDLTNYNKISEIGRQRAVLTDLYYNKPSNGYELEQLKTVFNAIVETREITEQSVNIFKGANEENPLEDIKYITMLISRFNEIKEVYTKHSNKDIKILISNLENLVERFNNLEDDQSKILKQIDYTKSTSSTATINALEKAIKAVELEVEERELINSTLNSLNENLTGNGLDLVSNNEKTELFNTLELNLETLNIDLTNYNKISEIGRQRAVLTDLYYNKPETGYELEQLKTVFNAIVETREITEQSVNIFKKASEENPLEDIEYITMLISRFNEIKEVYTKHSNKSIETLINKYQNLVNQFNNLNSEMKLNTLKQIDYSKSTSSTATINALEKAIDEVLESITNSLNIINSFTGKANEIETLKNNANILGINLEKFNTIFAGDANSQEGGRQTAVIIDIVQNKPESGYDLQTFQQYFKSIVDVRLANQEVMNDANEVENPTLENLRGYVETLKTAFEKATHTKHGISDSIENKRTEMNNLLTDFNKLNQEQQELVLDLMLTDTKFNLNRASKITTDLRKTIDEVSNIISKIKPNWEIESVSETNEETLPTEIKQALYKVVIKTTYENKNEAQKTNRSVSTYFTIPEGVKVYYPKWENNELTYVEGESEVLYGMEGHPLSADNIDTDGVVYITKIPEGSTSFDFTIKLVDVEWNITYGHTNLNVALS